MKLQASRSRLSGLLAFALASAVVPLVHAQEVSPPSAADGHVDVRAQPQERDSERAPSYPLPMMHAPIPEWSKVHSVRRVNAGQRHTALLTAGFLTFVLSVMTSEVVVMLMLQPFDSDEGCRADCQANKRAAFPLVGPFMAIAMPEMHKHDDIYALFGASQALGFAGMVAGAILFAQAPNKPSEATQRDRFMLSAMPTRDGAQLALRLRL
jgi:hypothetical protein